MRERNLNLSGSTFLIADPDPHFCTIVKNILRGFGAYRELMAHDADAAQRVMTEGRIDALLCDADLPPMGGIEFTRTVRRDPTHPCRSCPIIIMTGEATKSSIINARNAGAHVVVTKPLSPAMLYDRLAWIAFRSRQFFESDSYFGPDRRFKFEAGASGTRRRKGDQAVNVGEAAGPIPSRDDINSLLTVAHGGQG